MRLIGATDHFIRGPFIVEGVVIGLIGSLLPIGLLWILYSVLVKMAEQDLSTMATWLQLMDKGPMFLILTPVCLVLGLGIGLLGSMITVHKHLKV